ncbi:hypothetical protein JXA12_01665 [Candidatus Woesearchaeota archaeon]|nr:hypothetical protein [Candidatus Woesearchaeota archaeon]
MAKEERENNFALIALVAIVAVVGLVGLVMMQKGVTAAEEPVYIVGTGDTDGFTEAELAKIDAYFMSLSEEGNEAGMAVSGGCYRSCRDKGSGVLRCLEVCLL